MDNKQPNSQMNIASVFWSAAQPDSEERSPQVVVKHALDCLEAFEKKLVLAPRTGAPQSLMGLLAQMGMEENLVYSSPEMVRGEGFDERSLIFTIGVLIFERLTSHHPFGTNDNSVRVARLSRGEMGSGVNFLPMVPANLRKILIRAMGPFPEERYRTLAELTQDLHAFLLQGKREPTLPMVTDSTEQNRSSQQDAQRTKRQAEDLTIPANPLPSFDLSTHDSDATPVTLEPASPDAKRERKATLRRSGESVPLPPRAVIVAPAAPSLSEKPGIAGEKENSASVSLDDLPVKETPVAQILRYPVPQLPTESEASVLSPAPSISIKSTKWWTLVIRWGIPAACLILGFVSATIFFLISSPRKNPSATVVAPAPATTPAPTPAPIATPTPATQSVETPPDSQPAAPPAPPPPPAKKLSPLAQLNEASAKLGELIRPCGISKNGSSARLAIYLNKDGKALRLIVGKEPHITDEHVACVNRLLNKKMLDIILPRPGFAEWRIRIFPDRAETTLVGPPDLLKLLRKK